MSLKNRKNASLWSDRIYSSGNRGVKKDPGPRGTRDEEFLVPSLRGCCETFVTHSDNMGKNAYRVNRKFWDFELFRKILVWLKNILPNSIFVVVVVVVVVGSSVVVTSTVVVGPSVVIGSSVVVRIVDLIYLEKKDCGNVVPFILSRFSHFLAEQGVASVHHLVLHASFRLEWVKWYQFSINYNNLRIT